MEKIADDHSKLSAMKLSIGFFIEKLEHFIGDTNVTDENMLKLMSRLTDCIETFVSGAKLIKTNLTEPVIDKTILTCENVFECRLCNVQTGKTYNSLINHIRCKRHIAHVKNSEKATKSIKPKPSDERSIAAVPVKTKSTLISPASINMASVLNLSRPNELSDFQCPVQNAPPKAPVANAPPKAHVANAPPKAPVANAPVANLNNNNNNHSPINGFMNNVIYSPDYLRNYKELFKMPCPDTVIGFQQNIVNPSNNFLRNDEKIKSDDESDEHEQQLRSKTRKRNRKKRKTKNLDNQMLQNDVTLLDQTVISFLIGNFENDVEQFMATAQELSDKDLYVCITSNLTTCCKEMGLNVEVACFGSRIIDIGTSKSDLDVNITSTDSVNIDEDFLLNLQDALRKDSNWSDALHIKSRVSLVRAHNIEMNIDCDVTFNNDLAMANTELVKYYYAIQPECHKVAVFMRIWAEKTNLYRHMNTYTMNLLVFYYYQSKGYLPKVMDLIDAPTANAYWPNKFHWESLSELNIKIVTDFKATCLDLMDFYAHRVNFNAFVLSTFTGSALPKESFATEEFFKQYECYQGLNRHMKENQRAAESIKTNFSMAMCVQDPFAHDHNVGRCIGKSNLKRFKDYCHETYKILKDQISKSILNDRDDDDDDDDSS